MNKLKEVIQYKKEQFSKMIEIVKKNQINILEMKSSVNEIKTSIESFTNRVDQVEETRSTRLEKKVSNYHIQTTVRKKRRNYEQNI